MIWIHFELIIKHYFNLSKTTEKGAHIRQDHTGTECTCVRREESHLVAIISSNFTLHNEEISVIYLSI